VQVILYSKDERCFRNKIVQKTFFEMCRSFLKCWFISREGKCDQISLFYIHQSRI